MAELLDITQNKEEAHLRFMKKCGNDLYMWSSPDDESWEAIIYHIICVVGFSNFFLNWSTRGSNFVLQPKTWLESDVVHKHLVNDSVMADNDKMQSVVIHGRNKVILSGWLWVYQTQRRNRTSWTHPCLLNSDLCCLASFVLNSAQFSG